MHRLLALFLIPVAVLAIALLPRGAQSAPAADGHTRSITMACSQPVRDVGTGQQVFIGGVPWFAERGQIVLAHEWEGQPVYQFGGRRYLYIGSVTSPARFFIVEECGQPPAAPPPAPQLRQLAADTYVYEHTGYTTIFIVTDEGVIVGDPMGASRSGALKAAIESVTRQPVRYMVYSHHDADHNAGGGVFRDTAQYVAHAAAVEPIARRNDPNSPVPQITFRDRMTLRLGHAELQLSHVGLNHSESSLVLHYPARRLIWAVDFIPVNSVIFGPRSDGDYLPEWVESLRQVEAMDIDTIVPGHGSPGPKIWATWIRESLQDLVGAIQEAERRGMEARSPRMSEFVRSQLYFKYGGWDNFDSRIPVNIAGVYDLWDKFGRFSLN